MTICGFHVASPRHATVWCDSETYRDNEPFGRACKIGVNALAALIGVGTGTMGMIHAGAAAVQQSASLEDAIERLPLALFTARRAALATSAARAAHGGTYAVIGRSARFGRVVGWLFRSADCFDPALAHTWSSPSIDGLDAMAADEHGVLAAAQRQLGELRRTMLPDATGGSLVVAQLAGDRITTRRLCDLGHALAPPPGATRENPELTSIAAEGGLPRAGAGRSLSLSETPGAESTFLPFAEPEKEQSSNDQQPHA